MPQKNNTQETHHEEVDLDLIYSRIMDIKSTLDTHMAEEAIYKPKVVELVDILDRSKGVLWFIKVLSVISVAGWGFIYWVRDHIRF